ncbi:HAUS augmin-like complex subunit 6 isoform X2 [Salarias fasciatus]|uniref:HAUS augmin-like complex subunit 6 isoform X2 n=1 Tax=Salarias fasciatus TaxID=181472 RepID=UPI00117652E2|nr:HAUS augmin-like complex subunit 6 isoform X2 [Salarias fasciatus]
MAAATSSLDEKGKHLWITLLALGFRPDTETQSYASKTQTPAKHIKLGPSMFNRPNKDASRIVIHFLLVKLNPTRFREAYRNCWPVLTQKVDAEFRKLTCDWLQEIMEKMKGSKVVASLLLTPGGPKFVQLMLNLAKHVMLQDMRTFTTDESWVPESVENSTSSLDMEMKRFHLVRKRFLRAVVDQDHLLNEYKTQARTLTESIRELKARDAKLKELPKCQSSESEASRAEKIQKVRSLWSTIDEMLEVIKENQGAAERVLKGEVDQYKLDGKDQVLTIPNVLLERIQQLPQQLKSGNLRKDGKLNLLCVMELMNHALQLLKDERCRTSHAPKSQLSSEHLKKQCQQMNHLIEDLTLLKKKLAEEEVKFSHAVTEQEAAWDQRWKDMLKETPVASFLVVDPALDFLPPITLNSVEDEDGYQSSDLSHHSKLLCEQNETLLAKYDVYWYLFVFNYVVFLPVDESEANGIQDDSVLGLSTLKRSAQQPASVERLEETPVTPPQTSRPNTSLPRPAHAPPSQPVKTQPVKPPQVTVENKAHVRSKEACRTTKTQILDMEHDNLAEQFADALMATSPPEGNGNGFNLEDVLNNLQRDPFSARKQLPRTPESLIIDVKRSWQKALQENEAAKLEMVALNDSIDQKPSLPQGHRNVFSPDAPSNTLDFSSILFPIRRYDSQHKVLQSTLLSDTLNMDSADGRAKLYSLKNETLPELPSFDSLDLSDDVIENYDEGPLIPTMAETATKVCPSPCRAQQACGDSSVPQHMRTPERLKEAATDKVFSLDLDTLRTPSPLKENSLPQLLTFSPIDDM